MVLVIVLLKFELWSLAILSPRLPTAEWHLIPLSSPTTKLKKYMYILLDLGQGIFSRTQ